MSPAGTRLVAALAAAGATACATARPPAPLPPLPPPPPAAGSLRVTVIYPELADTGTGRYAVDGIASRDSAFVFGSAGRGDATVRVNGRPVPVYPTGAWIAWLPLPDDSVARFRVEARAGDAIDRLTFRAALPRRYVPPWDGAWVDSTSPSPTGDRWVRPGEPVRLSVRAAPGAEVALVMADGRRVPLLPDTAPTARAWGELAFATAPPDERRPRRDRYVRAWTGPLGPDPGHVLSPHVPPVPDDSGWARVEAVLDGDTARAVWRLRLGVIAGDVLPVAVVNDDTAGTGDADSLLPGRPAPWATYHWFFPTGTRAAVSGRWGGQVRLQLSARAAAWVNATDVQPLAPGTPPPGADRTARSPRLHPGPDRVTLRVPLAERIPFLVEEGARALRLRLYGVAADMDWIQYGGTDPLVELIAFAQPAADETVLRIELAEEVWGFRTRFDGTDLVLEIRRPPAIDPDHPLRGRRIAVDAGHPPAGARGPTGLYEGDVTLAVARRTAVLLRAAGAEPVLVRDDTLPLGLNERVRIAEDAGAELLVSIHANALPDGVNPFENNGTSVYYFHPRSAPLARAVNRALVRQFGVRDLGMGRGDLAMARVAWMPAVLAEGLFMMLPEQEAMLARPEGQLRYARGVVEGIATFLRERARR